MSNFSRKLLFSNYISLFQLTADFNHWYPENEHSLDDKLPLLKSKLLNISKTLSRRSPFEEELKKIAQGEFAILVV